MLVFNQILFPNLCSCCSISISSTILIRITKMLHIYVLSKLHSITYIWPWGFWDTHIFLLWISSTILILITKMLHIYVLIKFHSITYIWTWSFWVTLIFLFWMVKFTNSNYLKHFNDFFFLEIEKSMTKFAFVCWLFK